MIVLYCTTRPRAYLTWKRGYNLLYPDVEVHCVTHPNSARGYHPEQTFYVAGDHYHDLPADTTRYVEQKYKELQNA